MSCLPACLPIISLQSSSSSPPSHLLGHAQTGRSRCCSLLCPKSIFRTKMRCESADPVPVRVCHVGAPRRFFKAWYCTCAMFLSLSQQVGRCAESPTNPKTQARRPMPLEINLSERLLSGPHDEDEICALNVLRKALHLITHRSSHAMSTRSPRGLRRNDGVVGVRIILSP